MRCLYLLFCFVFSSVLYAQDAAETSSDAPADAGKFSGEGGLGLVVNSGNSNNETLNGNIKASYEKRSWKHAFGLDAKKTREDEVTTAQRYLLTQQSDYSFSEKTYIFEAFRYDDDEFSGFEYQASLSGGIGWHLIKTDETTLDLELGAGYKQNELNNGDTEDEGIIRLAEDYKTQLSETTQLFQGLLIESGDSNTVSEGTIGLKVAMSDKLALQLSYNVRHNSDPPPGNGSTDRTTAATLVYGF